MSRVSKIRGQGPLSHLDRLGFEVLTRSGLPELVDRVVDEAGRSEKRRRLLSTPFAVYFALAMCFPHADYLTILRLVKIRDPGLRPWTGANRSSLARARLRLKWTVMRSGPWYGHWTGKTISSAGHGCWPWMGRCWRCRTRRRTTTPSASPDRSAVRWGIRRPA
ncbi:transposase domain-containing protein [Streptomyces sp. NPDC101149]|uniref:transposase domain-containing protein n=1 Tax=Streptomyces sp. NPDC101149 TaxID=3366113 RepID=UPI0037F2EFC5